MAASLRKRRGVVRRPVTRLNDRVSELEAAPGQPRTADHASQLLTKLQTLDSDFRRIHFELIDLIDEADTGALDTEQDTIDKLDDDVSSLTVRLEALTSMATPAPALVAPPLDRRPLTRKLSRIKSGLDRIDDAIAITDPPIEQSLLTQYREEVSDYKKDIATLHEELVTKDIADDDDLLVTHTALERQLSTTSHKIKSLLVVIAAGTSAPATTDSAGVKLPKLDVPTFDGDIIHWKQFWDQFLVAVHSKTSLSNAEKTVYLQHAIKDGAAKNAIEGLSHSGDNYDEAIECLQSRFNRPHIIQRTHVQLIVNTPSLKEGSGKELRRLHDTVQQHVRALKTLGCDLPGKFITSMIELKLDVDTLFEWQKHSQSDANVPHYQELLDFIDLRAEPSCAAPQKQSQLPRKPHSRVNSFAANSEVNSSCVICRTGKHPLYMCTRFKSMSHDDKMQALKVNRMCTNCLGGGHSKVQCKSIQRCKMCQKPHHTLLHIETQNKVARDQNAPQEDIPVGSHAAAKLTSNVLLMTCRVLITAPDGSTIEARALLDNASSASFISERLAHSLSLPRMSQSVSVSGIGGVYHKPPTQSVTRFQLSSLQTSGRKINVTAVVVPRVTCDLPMKPVAFEMSWMHISDLPLADPGFGQPGRIDVLLGADIFVEVLRHGRRKGPTGSPTAFETDLGWVLCGNTGSTTSTSAQTNVHITTFHTSILSSDDILRSFWEIEESPSDQASLSVEEHAVVRHFESNHTRSKEGRFIVPYLRILMQDRLVNQDRKP